MLELLGTIWMIIKLLAGILAIMVLSGIIIAIIKDTLNEIFEGGNKNGK